MIANELKKRALELLADGTVARVLGWQPGELEHDWSPALFENAKDMEGFVYGKYAGANLSKYCLKLKKARPWSCSSPVTPSPLTSCCPNTA